MKKIIITDIGKHKIKFLNILRRVTKIGLKESVNIRNSLPGVLLDGVSDNHANILCKKLKEIGVDVQLEDTVTKDLLIRLPIKIKI